MADFKSEIFQEKTLLSGEYDVKTREDMISCFVSDICVMENDQIVIADSSNHKLKLLDAECSVADSFCIQGQPGVMCKTGSSEVACLVCTITGDHSFIQFVSVRGTTLVPANSFTVEKDKISRGGVCYLQECLFMLCGGQEIKVYDRTGSILRIISCSDLKGSTVMANIWTNGSDLIVTDGNKKIFVLDINGMRKTRITDKKFQAIYGLSAGTCGRIYFTSYYTNSIFTMDTKGKYKQEILGHSDGIKHPQAIAYMRNSNSIVIGSYGTDNIQIYSLN